MKRNKLGGEYSINGEDEKGIRGRIQKFPD